MLEKEYLLLLYLDPRSEIVILGLKCILLKLKYLYVKWAFHLQIAPTPLQLDNEHGFETQIVQ